MTIVSMRRAAGRVSLVLFALAGAGGCASAPPPAPAPVTEERDALGALNAEFRRAYAESRDRMLAAADPVLVVGNDTAVLIRAGGTREEAEVNAPLYHTLKTVAHIPLAIQVALTGVDGALDSERRATLDALRRLIPPALESFGEHALAPDLAARQQRIVDQSLAFLDGALARGESRDAELRSFVRGVAPDVSANVGDATRAQLDALHASVSRWRAGMSPQEWDRLHVVVIGAHMPREGSVMVQYFSRLLREPNEGSRIVYAESLWNEDAALDLLGTHLLDARIGDAFFAEPLRMHRDLLADDARAYLEVLLPD